MPKKTKGPTPAQHKKDVIEAIRALRKLNPGFLGSAAILGNGVNIFVDRLEDYLEGL